MNVSENPYRSPETDSNSESEYYCVNLSRVSFAELLRIQANQGWFTRLACCFLKLLYVPLRSQFGSTYEPIFLDYGGLPAAAREAIQQYQHPLAMAEFRPVFAHTVAHVGDVKVYSAEFLHEGGRLWASAYWTWSRFNNVVTQETGVSISSKRTDGALLITTDTRQRLDTPECIEAAHLPGAAPEAVISHHQTRLAAAPTEEFEQLNTDSLREEIVRLLHLLLTELKNKGVVEKLSPAEALALARRAPVDAEVLGD